MENQKLTILCKNCLRDLEEVESLEPLMAESGEGSAVTIRSEVDAVVQNEEQQPESDYTGAMRPRRRLNTKARVNRAAKKSRQRIKKRMKKSASAAAHKKRRAPRKPRRAMKRA